MPMTSYSYTIASAFPNAKVSISALHKAIFISAIATAMDRVDADGTDALVWFKEALSVDDKAILDGIIAAHDGVEPNTPRLVKLDTLYAGGKPSFVSNMFDDGISLVFAGQGDDIVNGTRMNGAVMSVSYSAIETGVKVQEWQYLEPIYLAGGRVYWENGTEGDSVHFDIIASASPGTSAPGAGAYDKVPVGGGLNIYVPNGTATGDWDLDLAATLNANVAFTACCPVPAPLKDGFFDYNTATNVLTLNPTATGAYNLFDAEITMGRHVNGLQVLGSNASEFMVPNISPRLMLPHWIQRMTVNHVTGGQTMCVVPTLLMGRANIQPS